MTAWTRSLRPAQIASRGGRRGCLLSLLLGLLGEGGWRAFGRPAVLLLGRADVVPVDLEASVFHVQLLRAVGEVACLLHDLLVCCGANLPWRDHRVNRVPVEPAHREVRDPLGARNCGVAYANLYIFPVGSEQAAAGRRRRGQLA